MTTARRRSAAMRIAIAILGCIALLSTIAIAAVADTADAQSAAPSAPLAALALSTQSGNVGDSLSSLSGGGSGGGALRSKSGLPHTPSRFAYVLMHYEGTPKDDEYLLGLRVLIRSIQDTKTPHDIVVITSTNVRESTKQALLDDGALLNEVANLQNPFETKVAGRNSYKSRFIYSFNKLYIWAMTQYTRVVFLDSDNIFLTNMDDVFFCGHFCVVYMNPLIFHTGLIVVKPDRDMFGKLLHALYADESFSHDGADQGFLVAQFDVEHAPLFLPAEHVAANTPSEAPAMRLNIGWNINHFWFYIGFSWDWFFHAPGTNEQYPWIREYNAGRTSVAGSSLAYCSGMMLKPWYWFPTLYFSHHYEWHAKRSQLGISYWGAFLGRLMALLPLWAVWHYFNSRARIDRLTFLDPVRNIILRVFALAPVLLGYLYGFAAFIAHGVLAYQVIPYTLPPSMAWTLWTSWTLSLAYMHLNLLVNIGLRPTAAAMRKGLVVNPQDSAAPAILTLSRVEREEINAVAASVSGWKAAALLCLGQAVLVLSWLDIYSHFIIKIALLEYWLLIWMGLQMHTFRRATEKMVALLPSART